jgi:transglutaminase-like putative cysteine protease
MVLDASCHISYRSNAPIPAIMMLRPRSGLPARMVVGYLYQVEPMDPSRLVRRLCRGALVTFDGTQERPRGNRITIGYGRDAADVALTSNYGALELNAMKVTVEIAP